VRFGAISAFFVIVRDCLPIADDCAVRVWWASWTGTLCGVRQRRLQENQTARAESEEPTNRKTSGQSGEFLRTQCLS
jgi:hypothetical protein